MGVRVTQNLQTDQECEVLLPQVCVKAVVRQSSLVECVDEGGIVLAGLGVGEVGTVGLQGGRG